MGQVLVTFPNGYLYYVCPFDECGYCNWFFLDSTNMIFCSLNIYYLKISLLDISSNVSVFQYDGCGEFANHVKIYHFTKQEIQL